MKNNEICDLEEMLDYAWHNAMKYRFDPVAGRIHEEYLEMLKNIKKTQETEKTIH